MLNVKKHSPICLSGEMHFSLHIEISCLLFATFLFYLSYHNKRLTRANATMKLAQKIRKKVKKY